MFPTVNLKRIISMAVVAGILVSCNNSSNTKKQTEVLPAKDITENTMEDKTLIVKKLEFIAEKCNLPIPQWDICRADGWCHAFSPWHSSAEHG